MAEGWATRRATKVVAGLLCLATVGWLGGKMHRAVMRDATEHDSDYEAFVSGGRAVLTGDDMFCPEDLGAERLYTLPAWFAVFMAPFEAMGYGAASFAWPLLNLAVLAASSYWCFQIVRGPGSRVPWPLLLLPVAALVRPFDSNADLGQINVLILGLVVGGLYSYARGRDAVAGLALAAATLTKPMPGLFLAYFLWKREWRVVAGAVVGLALLAFVVPMPFLGVRGGYDNLVDWLDKSILAYAGNVSEEENYVAGQTLRTVVYRLVTRSQALSHTEEDAYVNVLSLPPETAETIYRAGAVALLALLAVVCFGRGDRHDRARTAAELSVVTTAMLLMSPFARKAHFVLLTLPIVFAYSRLALAKAWTARDRVLLGTGIACVLLVGHSSDKLMGGLAKYATALVCMFWGGLALLVGLLVTLRGIRRAEAVPREPLTTTGDISGSATS